MKVQKRHISKDNYKTFFLSFAFLALISLLAGCGGGGGGGGTTPNPGTTPTVTAGVDKNAASTSELVTLTCATTGTISSLEGRCNTSDAFSAISSGSTKQCAYTSAGSYTPGCRINGATTDNVDSPVVITAPATARTLSGKLSTTIIIPAGADAKYPAGLAQDAGLSGWEVLVFSNSQITANPATTGISNLFSLTPVGTATTDASGNWSVSGLPAGVYNVWLRDENQNFQAALDLVSRDGSNKYSGSLDATSKLGWTDILFRSVDASSGNVTGLNEQPIPNLGAAYGLDAQFHESFVDLFAFMSDTRPQCYFDGTQTCSTGVTYGLNGGLVTLKGTDVHPSWFLNCGAYNNGSVDYAAQCATAITEWNTAIRSWRAVDGFSATAIGGQSQTIGTDYTDSTRSTVTFNQDAENFMQSLVLVIKNNQVQANIVKGDFEHEGFRAFGSITNSYISGSISSDSSGSILPIEGAFAAYVLGRQQNAHAGLIRPITGYSNEFSGRYVGTLLIQ